MKGIRAALFLLVWASCSWFGSWELNPNNATRLFAALSIVEDGDATIDEWGALTIDKARFGDHLYLDKAPGMTIMMLPAVAAMYVASPARSVDYADKSFSNVDLARFLRARTRLAVATGPALLTAAAAVLLFDLLLVLTGSAAAGLFAGLGYALGTPIWGWSTTIMGHAPVAASFVVAIWGVWRLRDRRWGAVLVGTALGWAVVIEHQAVLAGAVIAVWAAIRAWRRPGGVVWLGIAGVAGVAAMLPLLAYNLFAFGEPFRLGYQGVVGFEGMERGVFGLGSPDPEVLWEIMFGTRRGLLWVAPVLVLAPLGLAALGAEARTRGLALTAAAVAIVALLVNAAYFYWDGGNATGPRHAIPLVGAAAIGLGAYWPTLQRNGRIVAITLLTVSIAINAMIASAEIFAPPFHSLALKDAVWVRFATGDLHTVASEWWGWSPWAGFTSWAVPAVVTMLWLVWAARPAQS